MRSRCSLATSWEPAFTPSPIAGCSPVTWPRYWGSGPVGLCAVQAACAAGAADVIVVDSVPESLDEAPEAYALYDKREALKIVLAP